MMNDRTMTDKRLKSGLIYVVYVVLFFSVVFWGGCTRKVDTTADFAMALNGREYQVELAPAGAHINEVEAGYTNSFTYYIRFPVNAMKRFGGGTGFEFSFDPVAVQTGRVMSFRTGDENYRFGVIYVPALGHRLNEALMLEYSSRYDRGSLKVRFDVLEPEIGGRVKGVILEAVLFGYYQSAESMNPVPLPEPRKLEIYNFKFDTVFVSSPF